jgi:hypothetical protein
VCFRRRKWAKKQGDEAAFSGFVLRMLAVLFASGTLGQV